MTLNLKSEKGREIFLKLAATADVIVEDRITRARTIDSIYDSLPESDRAAVAKRDGIVTDAEDGASGEE